MKYLVMETHPAYAVVLDEEGRFLKAANLRYQVGDTVRDIVELRHPREKRPALWKPLSGVAGLAACLCLVFFGYYQPNFTPYGALRIQINPDVELTLSRTDRVLELEGLNPDGEELIDGYNFSGKDREDVTGELVERAISMGYLSSGETVSITVSSDDTDWQAREEQEAREDLEERYGEAIVIQIGPAAEEPGLWFPAPRQERDAQVLDGMLGEVQAGRVAWMVGESTLSLTDFTILPDLRGRHLGVQLLGQAVKYARRQGRYALTLACSADLAGYFAQYGFEETGRREGAVDMAMDLRLTIREVP